MWFARVSQVLALLLFAAAIFIAIYVTINLPEQEDELAALWIAGMTYMVFLVPVVLLYLLISLVSTLLLLPKTRRSSYGFDAAPWKYVFWANVTLLVFIVIINILPNLIMVMVPR